MNSMMFLWRSSIVVVSMCILASCAKPQLRPNSPEEETVSFVGALFENPFK